MSDPSKTQEAQTVPTSRRALWGLGGVTDTMMYQGVNGLVDQIYNIGMGISPVVLSLARSVPRFADMIIDPAIGHLSDNTRSRWGRRRPWMVVGAVLASLISVLMWFVPTAFGPRVSETYIVVMMVAFFTFAYSLFTIPYTAQGYELSTNYNERNHIFKWRMYAAAATGFLTPWLPWLCISIDSRFANLADGVKPTGAAVGIHWVCFGIAAIILLTALGPLFCGEGKGQKHEEIKISFRNAVRFTLTNRAFWPLVAGNFFTKFGMAITGIFFYYLLIYHMSGGDSEKGSAQWGVFCNVINVSTFIAMAPVVWVVDRAGKKPSLLALMLLSALAYGSVWFTFRPDQPGWVASVGHSLHQLFWLPEFLIRNWPSLATAASIGIFCNAMPLIINSMLADVCDADELTCGSQRQAFYGATFVTCDKIAMAVAMFLQGLLLSASGFDAEKAKSIGVSAETIGYWMKALLYTQPTGFIIGFAILLLYPITRTSALNTRRLLDQRKASSVP